MHFKKCQPLLVAGLLMAAIPSRAQQPFGAGNLVVYRTGDGSAAGTSAATYVFIDEYTTGGTLVQSIAMPTTSVAGGNYRLTASGSATSEGFLHLSPSGKYLGVSGYDAAIGQTSVNSSPSINRVAGFINSQGTVNTKNEYSGVAGSGFRSIVITDSLNFWLSGNGGTYYATPGSTTATALSTTITNVRNVNIFNGQLYFSTASGTAARIGTIGTGLPTTSGQTMTTLPGYPTSGSPEDFLLVTVNGNSVLYVADDGSTGGGLLKYSLVSGNWTANGSLGVSGDAYRGLTGVVNSNGSVTLYTTRKGNELATVTDSSGYNATATGTINLLASAGTNKNFRGVAFAPQCPAPVIGTQPLAQTVCAGTGATFTVAAAGTGLTYQWMKNGTAIGGATNSTYSIASTALTDTGSYSVVVTACNGTVSNNAYLTVNPLPTATITPATATTFCQGGSVVLNANTGTGYTYQWYNGATAISGASAASYTATASGSYTVTVTSNSCSATSAATAVTVNPAPTATITPSGATTFCTGGSVILNANTGSGLSYAWYNGATQISGASTSSYTATATGNYTAVVSNGTCSTTSSATAVTVNPAPTATITPATATTFCQGGSVVLNANTGTGLSYAWYNGAAQISGATAASYTATASGSYTVVVTNGCSTTSAATVVTVNPAPTATITPSGATTFCTGGSVILNANTGTGLSYAWYNGATQISGASTSSYTASATGNYTVIVSNGTCSTTSSATAVTVNTAPTATITPATATTFCQGGSVVLNANTGTGLTYQWYNGATSISGATAASYTANTSGSYTVVVTNGCSTTSAATVVTVNPAPTAAITPAGATTFCTGGSVILNANTGTGLTYQWYNGAASISGATTASYTASATGNYTVVVSNGTCSTTSSATAVTVNTAPTATITPAGTAAICQGDSVLLSANTGTGLSYTWKQGTNTISGATAATYKAYAAGSYTVVVSNGNCSATSAATVVTVNALPTATVTPAGATTFCQGGSVILNAATGTGYTYQWKQSATNISGATTASYTANASGTYTVKVTDGNSCSNTAAVTTVTVNALPANTISAATDTTFCQGGSVVLSVPAGTGNTYQWKNSGTVITGATSSSYTATAAGTYYVIIANTSNCSDSSATKTVTVHPLPVATVTVNGDTLGTGTFATYQWYFNNQPISGATSQHYTATQNGSYYVVVSDANSCSNNSDTANLTHVSVTNINAAAGLHIYPNPATDVLHVDAAVPVQVIIRDLTGKTVISATETNQVPLGNQPDGLYMISISDKAGHTLYSGRFLKMTR